MDFDKAFKSILAGLKKEGVDWALIGGFALAAAGYSRATDDIDFLVNKADWPRVKKLMGTLGYTLRHESEDAANFFGKDADRGRVDFLLAHRKYAKAMLDRAKKSDAVRGAGKIKVLIPEDLIGLKVQASSNDPLRYHRDIADVESIFIMNEGKLDMKIVREYFQIFDREAELDEILKKLENGR
jgi:hypothetical protein